MSASFPAVVGFTGSRLLPSAPHPHGLVHQVVGSVIASGRHISTGCASGADSAVIVATLQHHAAPSLTVHAAFGPGQPQHPSLPPWHGSWRFSGIPAVRAAAAAGAHVYWFAGAPSADATWGGNFKLVARLSRRSQHLVRSVASGAFQGAGLIAFVAAPPPRPVRVGSSWSPCGSGTWSTVAMSAGCGLPVLVFPVGFSPAALPPLGTGRWQPAAVSGLWSRAWRWQPTQPALPL